MTVPALPVVGYATRLKSKFKENTLAARGKTPS